MRQNVSWNQSQQAYHTFHGIDIRIARIFNVFGPRMRLNDGRALPAFIGQALRGENLTVFGDGSQTRSFCFVEDTIEAIYRLLLSDYCMPINIGNPDEISILDFAKEILELTNNKVSIIFKPLPVDDPKNRQPDISKAKEILGWEPRVSRPDGLRSPLIILNLFLPQNGRNSQRSLVKEIKNPELKLRITTTCIKSLLVKKKNLL
jgi:dTDP-glucose 4,6-dehydratase